MTPRAACTAGGALVAALALGPLLDACGEGPTGFTDGVGTLTVSPATWNGAAAMVGTVHAVAETGDRTVVFSTAGATVLTGAAVQASNDAVTEWSGAAVVPAAVGTGEVWVLGVDGMGRVLRLHDGAMFEDVSDRYGLAGMHVRTAVAADGRLAAFASDTNVVLADGTNVDRFALAFTALAAGGGRVAGVTGTGVMVEDGMTGMWSSYALPGARLVALDASGQLYVATDHDLFAADGNNALVARYHTDETLHGLAASGARVWFAAGSELGTVDGMPRAIRVTHGLGLATDAALTGSPSGDVWVLAAGALTRYRSSSGAMLSPEERWQRDIAPAFMRGCASCHTGATGPGHRDLSTYDAWVANRDSIYAHVVLRTPPVMPPTGTLPPDDLSVIQNWTAPGDGGM